MTFDSIQAKLGVTLGDIQGQANVSNWIDATTATDYYEWQLYTPGTKEYDYWFETYPTFTIAQDFATNSRTKAEASLAISSIPGTIFFDPGYVNGLSNQNTAALLMHEVLHNLGFDDSQVQGALGLDTNAASDNITQQFLKDCFK